MGGRMQAASDKALQHESLADELSEGRSSVANEKWSEEEKKQVLIQLGRTLLDLRGSSWERTT